MGLFSSWSLSIIDTSVMKSQKFESSDITALYDFYDVLGCIFKYKGLNVK